MKKNRLTKLAIGRKLSKGMVLILVTVLAAGMAIVPRVLADPAEQIRQLQRENAQNNSIVTQLRSQAGSYRDAIAQLQAQINNVQGQIDTSVARQNQIQASIVANELELARQRSVLGETIRVAYVEGRITTIEMLATSKNLSDFVDKEEYRTTIKNKIQATLIKISELQNQLRADKVEVERLLAEQQAKRADLAEARAEQSKMLSYNQAQQADYNQKTKSNLNRIEQLIAAQRRANNSTDGGYYFLRFSGPVKDFNPDNYPYKDAGFSMQLGPCSNHDSYPDSPDPWGYCTRQCVSFAAWAVGASGREIPKYYGNAKDWVGAARGNGVEITRTPQPGDIAISTSGTWGHAMYVLEVEATRIYVSQYNANLDGNHSYQWRKY